MLKDLSSLSVGCFMHGLFYGAEAYADDLVLLCPIFHALQVMLAYCTKFTSDHYAMQQKPAHLVWKKQDHT